MQKPSKRLAKWLNFHMKHKMQWPFLCHMGHQRNAYDCTGARLPRFDVPDEYFEMLEILRPQEGVDYPEGEDRTAWFLADDDHRYMAGAFMITLLEEAGL